jgi:endonuclease-8
MPEGDSVYRFAALLHGALAGKRIVAARAHGPGPSPQAGRLVGVTCTGARAQGKNIIISFENGLALRGHLRMYGTWHVYQPGEAWRFPERDARLVLQVHDAVAVNFHAPVIELLEERAVPLHRPIATLGPDLLDEAFDADDVLRRFRQPAHANRTIGDAIMDQRIMAGVGNIWKHETLFRCRINPWRTIAELDDDAIRGIIETARNLLLASVHKANSFGLTHRPKMFVYMRAGQPCFRCHVRLRRARQAEDIRFTAWCPECQPLQEGQAVLPRQ